MKHSQNLHSVVFDAISNGVIVFRNDDFARPSDTTDAARLGKASQMLNCCNESRFDVKGCLGVGLLDILNRAAKILFGHDIPEQLHLRTAFWGLSSRLMTSSWETRVPLTLPHRGYPV